jgi:DNA modification methylase
VSIRQLVGDCRVQLRNLPADSVQAVITSPPYYGLRDYGTEPLVWGQTCCDHPHQWEDAVRAPWANELPSAKSQTTRNNAFHESMGKTAGQFCSHVHDWQAVGKPAANGSVNSVMQGETLNGTSGTRKPSTSGVCACGAWLGSLGLEPTPDMFIEHLVEVFREVRRVLRPDGVAWVNLGDSMSGSGKGPTGKSGIGDQASRQGFVGGRSKDAPSCGMNGTRPRGCPDDDSSSTNLCDGCRAAFGFRNARSGTLLVDESTACEDDPSQDHNQSHSSENSQRQKRTSQSDHATLDLLPSPDHEVSLPLASPESTQQQSSQQLRGECSHCGNCGACLSVLRSSSRDSRLCVRTPAYMRGTDRQSGSLDSHMSGMGLSSTAYPHSTIALPPKNLLMMPARLAMALQADGWYLRSQIPWLKRNSMPESVTDRPATSVEYVYLLSKSRTYFWDADAVRMNVSGNAHSRGNGVNPKSLTAGYAPGQDEPNMPRLHRSKQNASFSGAVNELVSNRNRRNSDWFFESWQGLMLDEHDDPLALVVNPAPFSGAHFATFPPKLIEPMIKASTSERGCCPECGAPWVRIVEPGIRTNGTGAGTLGISNNRRATTSTRTGRIDGYTPPSRDAIGGSITTGWRPACKHTDAEPQPCTVLDCFGGAGTVGLVADRLGRNAILIDLKADYADMAHGRLTNDAPLFVNVEMGA